MGIVFNFWAIETMFLWHRRIGFIQTFGGQTQMENGLFDAEMKWGESVWSLKFRLVGPPLRSPPFTQKNKDKSRAFNFALLSELFTYLQAIAVVWGSERTGPAPGFTGFPTRNVEECLAHRHQSVRTVFRGDQRPGRIGPDGLCQRTGSDALSAASRRRIWFSSPVGREAPCPDTDLARSGDAPLRSTRLCARIAAKTSSV